MDPLEELHRGALACRRCALAKTRGRVVFGSGHAGASILLIGEAPGANEDRGGLPFIGQAGKLLDRALAEAALRREDLYIANVLKCRPPGNRNPKRDEIEQCRPWLEGQIEAIDPGVIVPMGNFALKLFAGASITIGKARGKRFGHGGRAVLPIYHPAALLYNRSLLPLFHEDMRSVAALAACTEQGAGGG